MGVLGRLIAAMREEDAVAGPSGEALDRQLAEFDAFVRATRVALEHHVPLHVGMTPPGHTDFGFYTVFAHCPVCKVGARGWNRENKQELHSCHVCATEYRPAETMSSTRMSFGAGDLRSALGAAFPEFAERYLVERGFSEVDAHQVVALTEAHELERQLKAREDADRRRRNDEYIRAVLFAGLHPTYSSDPDDEDETAEESAVPSIGSAEFSAEEFVELIARCERTGIAVTGMFHHAIDEKMRRSAFRDLGRPSARLAEWLAEGCSERFGALFLVPDDLLSASK